LPPASPFYQTWEKNFPFIKGAFMVNQIPQSCTSNKPKLLEQVRGAIRTKHYSCQTEQAFIPRTLWSISVPREKQIRAP